LEEEAMTIDTNIKFQEGKTQEAEGYFKDHSESEPETMPRREENMEDMGETLSGTKSPEPLVSPEKTESLLRSGTKKSPVRKPSKGFRLGSEDMDGIWDALDHLKETIDETQKIIEYWAKKR
jgi:hypothetical protein